MANISGTLPENWKDFVRATNVLSSKVEISSEKSSALKIDESNTTIAGLVDYSSECGGDISIKIGGFKKKIYTSKTVKEVVIDEASLIGDPDAVAAILKNLLSWFAKFSLVFLSQ